jgi:DNA-binding NtrC family response regulator
MSQNILVVDDEAPIRDLLQTFFKKRGYEVTIAATAADALRLTAEQSFQLVILDIALAETDGIELLVQLKQAHSSLPVVMLTGMGFDEELLEEATSKGAAGYVSKTLPLEQLWLEVQRALKPQAQNT